MNHTKGPWHIAELTKQYGVYDVTGTAVAKVGGAYGVAMERRMADARLISAAPEMYEALQLCVNAFGGTYEEEKKAYEAGMAALAKAEGK